MGASPLFLGFAQGLDKALDNIDQIRNENDDRAYKSMVAGLMLRRQIIDETNQGYHHGVAPFTPPSGSDTGNGTDSATPAPQIGNSTQSGPGLASFAPKAPTVTVTAPRGQVVSAIAPPTAQAQDDVPTGIKGAIARFFHSGSFAGADLPQIPALGPRNGMSEAEYAAQTAETNRRLDASTQFSREQELQREREAADLTKEGLIQDREDARSKADRKNQADLSAAQQLQQFKIAYDQAAAEDRAAQAEAQKITTFPGNIAVDPQTKALVVGRLMAAHARARAYQVDIDKMQGLPVQADPDSATIANMGSQAGLGGSDTTTVNKGAGGAGGAGGSGVNNVISLIRQGKIRYQDALNSPSISDGDKALIKRTFEAENDAGSAADSTLNARAAGGSGNIPLPTGPIRQ